MPKQAKAKTESPTNPRKMDIEGFVDEVKRINGTMKNRRFAFILGAGASKSSGIKTGGEFVNEWLNILYRRDAKRGKRTFDQWIAETKAGIGDLDRKKLAEFYPQVYSAAFQHDPDSGYAYLEDAMAKATPRYGYAVLAYILEKTQHKVVITVNFDNLVADALANYSEVFPLVCGHDSLASFAQPNLRRPLILKVHHDLLYAPKSEPGEIEKIGSGYKQAVERLLQHYTPIVIGYGGNDGSLMSVLEQLPRRTIPGGIFWCYLDTGDEPRPQILNLLSRQNGCLVPIPGFDELMAMLGEKLEFMVPDELIKKRAEQRAKDLVEHAQQLREALEKKTTQPSNGNKQEKATTEDQQKSRDAALKSLSATLEQTTDGKKRWWQWEELAAKEKQTNPARAEEIYSQALQELPDSVPLLGNYANFLNSTRRNFAKAQELYERALKTASNEAFILGNYANFLSDRGDFDRAQELYERALKAAPNNADQLGNFAIFLKNIRKDFDRAQELYERALTAAPNNANQLGNCAVFFRDARKDFDKAQELYERALKVDPNHVNNLGNYAIFLKDIRKDFDQAQELYERALKLAPHNPRQLGIYANFQSRIRKNFELAQELYERALKADPNHANNLGNYAGLLFAQGKSELARNLLRRAEQADTNLPKGPLMSELLFYSFAHESEAERPKALTKLKHRILNEGSRSPGWDLSLNVERATKDGHPDAAWLGKLAAVVNGDAEPSTLDAWPAWQKAG